jgi:hypothetical protein
VNHDQVHPIFEYVTTRGAGQPKFVEEVRREALLAGIIATLSSPFLNALKRPPANDASPDLLFLGVRYRQIFEDLHPGSVCLIGSIRVALAGLKAGIPYHVTGTQQLRLRRLLRVDPALASREAASMLSQAQRRLEKIAPRALIVSNDSLPESRLLIQAARALSIPSFCIQHGIFQHTSSWQLWDGHFADFMLVWGQRQADAYIARGMSADKVHVLGSPFGRQHNPGKPLRPDTLCFLGQPWESVSDQLGVLKRRIFEDACKSLGQTGISCIYKPHPRERLGKFTPAGLQIFKGSMPEALRAFTSFASLTSTALLEASLHDRLAVQLYHPAFECEDFEEAGYSYSLPTTDMPGLAALLNGQVGAFAVPESLVRSVESPARELCRLVEALAN